MDSEQIKTVRLTPVKEHPAEWDAIELKIRELFRKEIYLPLIKELGVSSRTLQNSSDKLREAIASGRIQYSRGSFSGRFNATISKELRALGAQWDKATRKFKIPQSSLPLEIRADISASISRFDEVIERIDAKLRKIIPEEITDKLKVADLFSRTLYRVDKKLNETMKAITVAPVLTEERLKRMSDEYQLDMDRWINDFLIEEIAKLRKSMQASVFIGNRYETAVATIQKSYGVSVNKAKFLARQETNLAVAKFKQIRYQEAGVEEYIWGCVTGSALHPVRPWHKKLEGKKFRFDNPPITTEPGTPARRNNPSQDYNCRCFAMPVVKFKKEKK